MDLRVASAYNAFNVYQVKNTQGNQKVERSGKTASKDTFSISLQAEDYQVVRKALTAVPDIREGLVNDIKAKIAAGTYEMNASAVAAKIFHGLE